VIGGLAGAVIGGAISAVSQGITEGWDNIDLRRVGGAAAEGAVVGAVGGLTMGAGLVVSAATMAGASVVGNTTNQLIVSKGRSVDWREVAVAGVTGAVGGGASKLALQGAARLTSGVSNVVLRETLSGAASGLATSVASNSAGQFTGMALGTQSGFNWRSFGTSVLTGTGIGGGMGFVSGKIMSRTGGPYKDTGGHHVQQEGAFTSKKHGTSSNYSASEAYAVRETYLQEQGIQHPQKSGTPSVSSTQNTLQRALRNSGRQNTLTRQTNIAYQALRGGGATRTQASMMTYASLWDMLSRGVRKPVHIPVPGR